MFRLKRSLCYVGLFGVTTVGLLSIRSRSIDDIKGNDAFSQYTRQQMKKYRFSGMHQPFITTDQQQLDIFRKHFSQYAYLIPENIETMIDQHALQTPVQMKSLSQCPIQLTNVNETTLVVGGAPALVSALHFVKNNSNLIYLNDERRIPIAYGSAWHLEQDAITEAPTSFRPSTFLINQLTRATVNYQTYKSIEQTGLFPWRTIDWIGWIQHPEHWFRALKLAITYQLFVLFDDRQKTLDSIAQQCRANEQFFDDLNQQFNQQLLLKGKGSIIIARNQQQIQDVNLLKHQLENEQRTLKILSKEEIIQRYGFLPNGLLFAEKTHDRVLSANFMKLSQDFIRKHGGQVLDGTLTTIYTDEQQSSAIAQYQTQDGQTKFIQFSRLIMSLGSQPIHKENNKRLFDVISARGVSILAHVYVPKGFQLPPVVVCGETNHVTKLNETPISIQHSNGTNYDVYLMRLTAGACITPNVSDRTTAFYDGSIAFGLLSAVKQTFTNQILIEPLSVYGCNRQVSRNGQIAWIQPFNSVFIQYGAAGGGLTRAPDFVTKS